MEPEFSLRTSHCHSRNATALIPDGVVFYYNDVDEDLFCPYELTDGHDQDSDRIAISLLVILILILMMLMMMILMTLMMMLCFLWAVFMVTLCNYSRIAIKFSNDK